MDIARSQTAPTPALQATVSQGVLTITTTNDLAADNAWIERQALLRRYEAQELVLQWVDPAAPDEDPPVVLSYRPTVDAEIALPSA